ncbi:MAG: AAA family ATPase [Nitriliruptoraceae bacterium]
MSEGEAGTAWIVAGAPGSGKSTLAARLAAQQRAFLLDRDVVIAPLIRVIAELVGAARDDLDDPRVRDALGDQGYEAVLVTARQNLLLGRDVVIVAPFTRALAEPRQARELRKRLGSAPLRVAWLSCPEEERRRRLERRGATRDAGKLEAAALAAEVEPVVRHAVIDCRWPIDEQLSAARRAPVIAGEEASP